MANRNSTVKLRMQFETVVSIARDGTWRQLLHAIDNYVNPNGETLRGSRKATGKRVDMNVLLSVVVLESAVEIMKKIDGLISIYDAEVDFKGVYTRGKTLCMKAVFNKNSEAAIALLLQGADPNKICNMWGDNMYVFAAANNLLEIFETMTLCGANPYQMNANGECAVIVAVRGGHLEIVKQLFQMGVDPDWYTMEDHMTLLHWAVTNKNSTSTAMVQFLLDHGANPHLRCMSKNVFQCKRSWYTPLAFMVSYDMYYHNNDLYTDEEMAIVSVNANLLIEKMEQDVVARRSAFCMVSNERLSSKTECGLGSLTGEPSLLQLIMDNSMDKFDIKYPGTPLPPDVNEYNGVMDR
jgi:hypothetical protein